MPHELLHRATKPEVPVVCGMPRQFGIFMSQRRQCHGLHTLESACNY